MRPTARANRLPAPASAMALPRLTGAPKRRSYNQSGVASRRTVTAKRLELAIREDELTEGFQFFRTGQKLDRHAIVSLERDALASLICQADETGRGRGIIPLNGHKYVIGRNHRSEAICLVWKGAAKSEVTPEILKAAAAEVSAIGLKRPFRVYGTFCRIGDTRSWRFCQIPDEILAQMHIADEAVPEGIWPLSSHRRSFPKQFTLWSLAIAGEGTPSRDPRRFGGRLLACARFLLKASLFAPTQRSFLSRPSGLRT